MDNKNNFLSVIDNKLTVMKFSINIAEKFSIRFICLKDNCLCLKLTISQQSTEKSSI